MCSVGPGLAGEGIMGTGPGMGGVAGEGVEAVPHWTCVELVLGDGPCGSAGQIQFMVCIFALACSCPHGITCLHLLAAQRANFKRSTGDGSIL